ncbi:MAG: hypothetical protein ABIU54_01585 [Candidatus Eisenbacteria bacterium]
MNRPLTVVLVLLTLILAVGATVLYQQNQRTEAALATVQSSEQDAQQRYADAFRDIAEIQDSLNSIAINDGSQQMSNRALQSELKLAGPNRREALERIAQLGASIQRTKQRIRELESSQKRSGVKMVGMERVIANLKQTVLTKEASIAALTGRVDSLQTQVVGLQSTVEADQATIIARDQAIEDKRSELATIFYVVGSKKTLTNAGIIGPKGGILGLGRTQQLTGRYDAQLFKSLDTDHELVVNIPSTKVQVLSSQPRASYQLRTIGNGIELHILGATEFRKVKHLVVLIG